MAARPFGWRITRADCWSGGYHVDGWKQFDRFVALLSIGWSEYTDQFSVGAETPPVNAGGSNERPARSAELDLRQSCLVTGEDTINDGGGGPGSVQPAFAGCEYRRGLAPGDGSTEFKRPIESPYRFGGA